MLTMSAPRLELTEEEREALEAVARSSSLPHVLCFKPRSCC